MDDLIIVTYRDKNGDKLKGLLVDNKLHTSVTGNQFVFVNNFANRILIENILSFN